MKNRKCPACAEVGRDKKGDHLFVMEDMETWYCNKPYHKDGKPYKEYKGKAVSMETPTGCKMDFDKVAKELSSGPIRRLPLEVCDKYQCKVEHSETTGDIVRHYYPVTKDLKLVDYKIRVLPKTFFHLKGGHKGVDLMGRLAFPFTPRILLITEGEIDAMAAYWMTRGKYSKIACVSLPNGANPKDLEHSRKYIESADTIILCPDQDEVGEKFVKKAVSMYPKAKVMSFSEKDAYDMYNEGKAAEFLDALDNAETYRLASVLTAGDTKTSALVPPTYGLSYPFAGLDRSTFGLRTKRVIGIGAGPGAGKTTFVKSIQTHIIMEHKIPIGIFPLEEDPPDVIRELAGFVMNKPLHLPSCEPGTGYDPVELDRVIDSFGDLVHIYDPDEYTGWKDIEATIRYMASLGVKYVFIDPLSALTAHLSASDANQYLGEAMWKIKQLTKQLDITVFHINHLNNPQSGKDHGAGGKVYAGQFTGSKAMWRFSTDIWGLERDQYAEDPNLRDVSKLVVLKYRKPSLPGSFDMKYDIKKGTLSEVPKITGGF